ncbi:MAG TPA: serine protease, partial [Candidatus Saccharimonadales bacterium]|nr:serine protease [Candidatus Saccharimonadales bacterium]
MARFAAGTGSLRWLAIGCSAMLVVAGCSGSAATATPASSSTPAPSVSASPAAAGSFDLGTLQNSVAYVQTQGTFVTADGTSEQVYSGSGFVVGPSGLIVTNNHVVAGGAFWKVQIGTDPTLLDARLLGVSECNDLAVLKVDGTFPALTLATTPPEVGEQIFVAGHPNGDPYTLTNGIVAKPPYPDDTAWASVTQEIQITAQTYPGNSGSPVVDTAGQVIGIQYSGGVPGSPIAGESFAIASTEAAPIIAQLETGQNLDTIGVNGEADATRK